MAIQGSTPIPPKGFTVGDAKEGDIVVVEAKVVRVEKSYSNSSETKTYVQFPGISEIAFFDNRIPVKEIKYDFKVGDLVTSQASLGKHGKILFILKNEEKALVEWDGLYSHSQKHSVIQLKNIKPKSQFRGGL